MTAKGERITLISPDVVIASSADLDAIDAEEYAAGRVELDEYVARVVARHQDAGKRTGTRSLDPVAIYDAMREAGTSLMGSYVWLADHAATEGEAAKWWAAYAAVQTERELVDARDVAAQQTATAAYVAREEAVRALVRA